MSERQDVDAVVCYPRDAILDAEQVGRALRVGSESVLKMDLPCFYVGKRARFLWGQVLDTLAQRAQPVTERQSA